MVYDSFFRQHSKGCIKSIDLKMNYFFGFSKIWPFIALQFFHVRVETCSTSKSLELYTFLYISLQKYVLCVTYKLYQFTEIFSNLYTRDLYIFSFISQIYPDSLISQQYISLYLKYIPTQTRGWFSFIN